MKLFFIVLILSLSACATKKALMRNCHDAQYGSFYICDPY